MFDDDLGDNGEVVSDECDYGEDNGDHNNEKATHSTAVSPFEPIEC